MFENMLSIFGGKNSAKGLLGKDAVAELLHTNPDALDAFEEAYAKHALSQEPEGLFGTNSRQAAAQNHSNAETGSEAERGTMEVLQRRIVDELLAQTVAYTFDGTLAKVEKPRALPSGTLPVRQEDINNLPITLRPQLTGDLMKVDIGGSSYPSVMFFYERYLSGSTEKERRDAYNHFRQGLDILDLDHVLYEIIGMNPNSMGKWLPQLVEACREQTFFRIPATSIVKVPLTLLQLTRQEYTELTPTTMAIVDQWAYEAFHLNDSLEYFIKTGDYSSKFDFRNAKVAGVKEVQELGEYLLFIHYQALQMASSLCHPCIYGVSTTNEWVVREFIPDQEGNPCIYKGLPLHTEYRVFVDCDTNHVIGVAPYWEPDTMKQRFGHEEDADSPHQIHDYVIYQSHQSTLMHRYHEYKDSVCSHIEEILPGLELHGQWSIDVMQNGDEFYLIDMALAENSAFYNYVPQELRNPSKEDWMPQLMGHES